MTSRGLPPLFGAPWERQEQYIPQTIKATDVHLDRITVDRMAVLLDERFPFVYLQFYEPGKLITLAQLKLDADTAARLGAILKDYGNASKQGWPQ